MRLKESESLELKKSTAELKEAVISIVAILNKHKKGMVYLGVRNDGRVIGQQSSDTTLREISQTIANNIEPKIYPEIKSELIDGKDCITIAFEGHEQPYFAYGRAYMRVADEDRQLSAKELENLILRKTATRWDSKVSDMTLDEIDDETLKEFIQKANLAQRIKFKYTNKKDVLKKLELVKDSRLINAARLLFSKGGPIEVQAAVFAGIDKTTFLDIKQFKGNIIQLLQMSESYIKEHINWKAELAQRTREEIPEIPVRAITESLVNSFCHRDYQAPESNKISIYKDRVEIWNPGDFPEGYRQPDFIKKNLPSILRNPIIANILYLSSDTEKWGSGLRRIDEACEKESIPVSFDVLKYGFSVVFGRDRSLSADVIEKSTPQVTPQVTPQELLTKLELQILEKIRENPKISRNELAKTMNISSYTIKEYIERLKSKGVLKRVGKTSAGHWVVKHTVLPSSFPDRALKKSQKKSL